MPETGLCVKTIWVILNAMIGVFDSGHGGLTVMKALAERFPNRDFIYFGDHGFAPYGERSGPEIVNLTATACDRLFKAGCKLVVMACNTATAMAGRTLQQEWMPVHWPDRKLLGIIAPTVEAATQTPWSVKVPVFPQKFNTDTLALFATTATVKSGVFETEIHKRCPRIRVVAKACPTLVPLLESGATRAEMQAAVEGYVAALLGGLEKAPEEAILGCTHYPLIAELFRAALPPQTRLMDQPRAVADGLEDYLERHPEFDAMGLGSVRYYTSGDVMEVRRVAGMLVGAVQFEAAGVLV